MNLYPLKFRPVFKRTIWGGTKLRQLLHKTLSLENTGESWEISAVAGQLCTAKNGPLAGKDLDFLCKHFGPQLLGEKVAWQAGDSFPLLFKFIDAAQDLSVQVHPADNPASAIHGGFENTKMWYILQADPGACIHIGFEDPITLPEYAALLQEGKLLQRLVPYEVQPGDCFLIPPGRIYAIGAGILLAEVKPVANITYRLYDYHRKGLDGQERPLQTEQAQHIIDFSVTEQARTRYIARLNQPVNVAKNPCFTVNVLELQGQMRRDLKEQKSFVIYVCVKGQTQLTCDSYTLPLQMGETVLIPAQCADCLLHADQAKLLEIYV